jgi:hypothetical protein
MNLPLAIVGFVIAAGSAVWWYETIVVRLGTTAVHASVLVVWRIFECLAKVGAGECGTLWFAGLQQSNAIMGLLFYIGLALMVFGLALPAPWSGTKKTK